MKGRDTLGNHIRALRLDKDLSLRELAKKIGCSPAFLSDVELDRRAPADDMFSKIAGALGVPVDELQKCDTRPPVDDVRRLTQADPQYAYALRKMLNAAATSTELLSAIEKIEAERNKQ